MYNNIFSIATDTHMSIAEDGSRIITGSLIKKNDWEDRYLHARNVGGYVFPKDYWSISCFLSKYGLCGVKETFNGDIVYKLTDCPQDAFNAICPSCCHVPESNIPERLSAITTQGSDAFVQECFKRASNVYEVVENLNNSAFIKGEWILYNESIIGNIGNKVYIMKSLKDSINENVNIKPTFTLHHDVYNVLSDLAFEYNKKHKSFDEEELREAFDNFMNKFFVENDDDFED
jgi:hypothetical protein